MTPFTISGGGSTTFVDNTPGGGVVIDFTSLDNSFNVTVNGVQLFVGGPAGAPNEVQFQSIGLSSGITVRFDSDDATYGSGSIPQIFALNGTVANPLIRLEINPDGTISLQGSRSSGGPLEDLEVFNGLTVNSAAIAAAWNSSGSNTIVVDQFLDGPTNATGQFSDVPCFAAGTLIETIEGPKLVEDLRIGDKVLTYDHGYQPIVLIPSRKLTEDELNARPNLKPIIIRANALGLGFPKTDLVVSPQHRMLGASPIFERMFDHAEVLVAAKKLLMVEGVDVIDHNPNGVEYYHLTMDKHYIIYANGAPTESLLLGPQALKSMPENTMSEILEIFPECLDANFCPQSARIVPNVGKTVKEAIRRHLKNRKPIFSPNGLHPTLSQKSSVAIERPVA